MINLKKQDTDQVMFRKTVVSCSGIKNQILKTKNKNKIKPLTKESEIDTIPVTQNEFESENRKIASTVKQQVYGINFQIITWKNFILSQRNLFNLFAEIFGHVLVIITLLVIRYFTHAVKYQEKSNDLSNVFDLFPETNKTILLYYPNNTFIEDIISQVINLIKKRKSFSNITGK